MPSVSLVQGWPSAAPRKCHPVNEQRAWEAGCCLSLAIPPPHALGAECRERLSNGRNKAVLCTQPTGQLHRDGLCTQENKMVQGPKQRSPERTVSCHFHLQGTDGRGPPPGQPCQGAPSCFLPVTACSPRTGSGRALMTMGACILVHCFGPVGLAAPGG